MKVVINKCYGGFGLSKAAVDLYAELKDMDPGRYNKQGNFYENINEYDISRDDPVLVQVVESLGDLANDIYAELKVVEIPDGVNWSIEEYDGREWIAEVHRTWS